MTYALRVSRRAAQRIRQISDWWVENREKAPSAFADDLAAAIDVITEFPKLGEAVRHPRRAHLRRMLLPRTRYYLYYAIDADNESIEILTLWHTSRGSEPSL